MENNRTKSVAAVADRSPQPLLALSSRAVSSDKFWRWGDDNLFPVALALMSRRSTTHRRIINDKADYISGKGFTCDGEHEPQLAAFIRRVNGEGESLRQLLNKLAFDKALFGNAFLEAVTDPGHTFLALYHQDATRCRVARDSQHILLHHDWSAFRAEEARTLPLYPLFEEQADGTLRTMIHYKDYEPAFEHYGVPPYIAGLNVSAIAYKTDRWNISRLDNSFQLSGVMMLDSSAGNEADAEDAVHDAFVVLAENFQKFSLLERHKTRAFLVTIVEHKAIDLYRKKQRRGEAPLVEEISGIDPGPQGDASPLAQCILRLPGRYREFFRLKYELGYSTREAGQLMGLSWAAARKLEQRAKEKLRALCQEEGIL